MAQQKLYTEEQVRKIIAKTKQFKNLADDWLIATVIPIELPSDEDIDKRFDTNTNRLDSQMYESGFRDGAKWMKKEILNQNK